MNMSSALSSLAPSNGRERGSRNTSSSAPRPTGGSSRTAQSPSQLLGRRATQERIIVELELEVEQLREKCDTYRETVAELRAEITKLMVKGCTKKGMRKSLRHNEVDDRLASAITKLCKEWMFPRFKFLHDEWMEYTESRKGLPRIIIERCPIPAGTDRIDMWNRVIAPTVSRTYANMRCNIHNEVKKAFKGE